MRLAPALGSSVVVGWLLSSVAFAEPVGIAVKTSGPSDFTMTVKVDAEALPVKRAVAGGLTFTKIEAGDPKIVRTPGSPDLPAFHRLIAVDPDLRYQVKVSLGGRVVYENVLLMPEQPDLIDDGRKAPFAFDAQAYASDQTLGASTVTVGYLSQIGPVSVLPITITPFHYNPKRKELTVWKTVTAHVSASAGADARFADDAARVTPFQAAQIKDLVENGKEVLEAVRPVAMPRLLVMTTTDLLPKARELATAGRTREMSFEFVTVDQLRDSPSIRAAIASSYARGDLDSVLFFGDEAKIPLHAWTASMPGDTYYGLLDGTDNYLDVGLGRLPVSDAAEADLVIAKIKRYDELRRGGRVNKQVMLAAHKEEYPGKYTANQERVRSAANPIGLNYVTFYGGAGADNAQVVQAINQGYGLIAYRGHGDDTTWWNWDKNGAGFTASHVAELTARDGNLTVFFDIACANGAIQENAPSLAEILLYHADGQGGGRGAVAVLAATIDSFTEVNHRFNEYLFQAIQNEVTPDLGTIVGLANNRLIRDAGGSMPPNVKMYILFGDPAMKPWLQ